MIQRLFQAAWTSRREILKYAVVGGSGVALDIISLALLKEWFGLSPTIAVIINQAFLLAYIFFLNKFWSFRNTDVPHKQIVRFLILASFNYAFSVSTMYWLNHIHSVHYLAVRLGSIALMTSWNFVLYKQWVYRIATEHRQSTEPAAG